MRLIDADILREKLLMMECMEEVIEIIDEQSTAYDIDKVVGELEDEIDCNDHCSYKGAYCGRGNCRWSIIDDVIEIVKAGEKNEVEK